MHDGVVESLVGRARELEQLMEFAQSSTQHGGGLLVHGPAGIGKSFILAALRDQTREQGFQQLLLSGVQSEARLAFAGLHQLLRPVIDRAVELPSRQRDALLSAFGMNDSAAPDPYLIALAVLELLALIATRTPVLVVVDDAQWVDPPTAEALAFVVRRLGDDHVALRHLDARRLRVTLECARAPRARARSARRGQMRPRSSTCAHRTSRHACAGGSWPRRGAIPWRSWSSPRHPLTRGARTRARSPTCR